ncbi:MAG: response regulator, partial [Acidobacteriota bacterium]
MTARILIVDDEPKMAASIQKALTRSGYRCAVATDGERAEEIFDDQGADVVVTDRRMPGTGGLELMERLLAKEPDLPVILITAYGDVRSAVDAMGRGAFHFLVKPFDLDELRGLIARALEVRHLQEENRQLRQELADHKAGSLIA